MQSALSEVSAVDLLPTPDGYPESSGQPGDGLTGSRERGLAAVLVEFAHTLGTDFSIQKILDHLVRRIVEILPISGAGVMLMGTNDELHFISASNEVVTRIEDLQNKLHQGPCLDAYRTGEPVAITDLSVDTRFPEFSTEAATHGLAAVFTFPMRLDAARLGALDLYRDTAGPLNAADLRAAQILADVAAAYLFNTQARIDASAAVARLHHRSLHDPLTGLPNRTLLEELLDQAVARGRRSRHLAAVLFVDLDGFKLVNDRHGHHVGDGVLRAVADRLSAILRPGDTLARLGGDEFVVLCEDIRAVGDAETVADRILESLSRPFELGGRQVSVTASVGIAFSGDGQDIPEILLRNADFAMYQAKARGGGHYRVVDPAARLAADRRDDLEQDLMRAQDADQLYLDYQPILTTGKRELVGVEALLRWQHPERGRVGPEVIVPSAERTGLIGALGEWVLGRAGRDFHHWQMLPAPIPSIAVNVSAHQVMGPAFADTVERILDRTGARPHAVFLEVTETVLLADAPRALSVLHDLKDLGVRLCLDDFGTGYSSLNYLREFPFDVVKIDRSFTAALGLDRTTRSIVAAMIDLSHALGLTVTAEGVETAAELADLTRLGADHVQGFHLSEPLTSGLLTDYAEQLQ